MTDAVKRFAELKDLVKPVEVFEFEKTMYLGNYNEALQTYARLNPSKKFYIWLNDNYKRLYTV